MLNPFLNKYTLGIKWLALCSNVAFGKLKEFSTLHWTRKYIPCSHQHEFSLYSETDEANLLSLSISLTLILI